MPFRSSRLCDPIVRRLGTWNSAPTLHNPGIWADIEGIEAFLTEEVPKMAVRNPDRQQCWAAWQDFCDHYEVYNSLIFVPCLVGSFLYGQRDRPATPLRWLGHFQYWLLRGQMRVADEHNVKPLEGLRRLAKQWLAAATRDKPKSWRRPLETEFLLWLFKQAQRFHAMSPAYQWSYPLRDIAAILTASCFGCRSSETRAQLIRHTMLDFDTATQQRVVAWKFMEQKAQLWATSERRCSVNIMVQTMEWYMPRVRATKSDWLFPSGGWSVLNKPLTSDNIQTILKKWHKQWWVETHQVPRFGQEYTPPSWHCCRVTAITLLLQVGASLKMASAWCRWASQAVLLYLRCFMEVVTPHTSRGRAPLRGAPGHWGLELD